MMCIVYGEVTISPSKSQFRAKNVARLLPVVVRSERRVHEHSTVTINGGTSWKTTSPSSTFAIAARYVEADASIALCCLWVLTDWSFSIRSSTTDAKINKHSLTNCKIQILWQSAKSNQEETAPLVSVCGLQQTLLMRFFFFPSTKYVPIHFFPPIFLQSSVHTLA